MIRYLTGDATDPKPATDDPAERFLIMHICNDVGVWGAGFVLDLSKRWREPEQAFRAGTLLLGSMQLIRVRDFLGRTYVANLVAQHGLRSQSNPRPLLYTRLRQCLIALNDYIENDTQRFTTIHAPRLGTGLAGGEWLTVEKILNEVMYHRNITIYDLPK